MNCIQTEKLLALYAAGDLAAGKARAVSTHLQSCESCRRQADEFAATRELLLAYAPPEFDAAFFESIRQGVMSEIKRESPPPIFAPLFPRLFSRKALAYATSFALLVMVGTFALKIWNNRADTGNSQTHSVANAGGMNNDENVDVSDTNGVELGFASSPTPMLPEVIATQSRRRNGAPPNSSRTVHMKTARTYRKHTQDEGVAAVTSATNNFSPRLGVAWDLTGDGKTSIRGGYSVAYAETLVADQRAGVTEERKMLRIELQTSDPNVRIIWLSPQAAESLPKK